MKEITAIIRRDKIQETKKVLDDLGVTRYCCRRMILSHVEIIDDVIKFHEGQKGLEVKGGN